jgi:hypothetical protein
VLTFVLHPTRTPGLSRKNSGLLFAFAVLLFAAGEDGVGGSFFEINGTILNRVTVGMEESPMIHTADVQGLKVKINQLQTEHRDLDDVISRLSQSTAQDQIQLQRLKKRKLLLKDQIAILERQLEPDIPA